MAMIDPSVSTPAPGSLQPQGSPIDGNLVSSAPSTPSIGALEPQSSPTPTGISNPTMTSQDLTAAPDNSAHPWRSVLQGALWGLAGAARKAPGRSSFGAGVGMGVEGAMTGEEQQQKMHFSSAQAAANIANIVAETKLRETENDEHKLAYQTAALQHDAFLEFLGVPKVATVSAKTPAEMNNQAPAALNTVKASDPQNLIHANIVATINPSTSSDQNNTVNLYKMDSGWVKNNPEKARAMVDLAAISHQQPRIADQQWNFMGVDPKTFSPANAVQSTIARNHAQGVASATAYSDMLAMPSIERGDPTKPNSMTPANADGANQRRVIEYGQQLTNLKNADIPAGSPLAEMRDNVLPRMKSNLDQFTKMTNEYHDQVQGNEAAQSGKVEAAKLAAQYNPLTPEGQRNIEEKQQNIIDKKFTNADKHQKALLDYGADPEDPTKKLNLSTPGADELLFDAHTEQPIPNKNVHAIQPSQQETNRADFARSALHTLDIIDQLRAKGKLPNGPIDGRVTKAAQDLGIGGKGQEASDLIQFSSSASTGAHVGGRFTQPVLEKMDHMLSLNMNDEQFAAAERAIREVMTPYMERGGRMSVGEAKQNMLGETIVQNGQTLVVTGFNKNGERILTPRN